MNARPKTKDEDKRSQRINFMVSVKEKKEIETLAKLSGYPFISDYIRRVALGYEHGDRSKL